MAKHQKSQFAIYAEFIPFYLLYQLLRLLPFRWGCALTVRLFDLLFLTAGKLRKRTISHILHAGVEKTPEKARDLARRTFRQFARLVVEIAKMDQEYRPEKIRISGSEATIAEVFARDGKPGRQNVIIVTAHYGNWEVAGTAFSEKAGRSMVSIMRPFSNPLIGELILKHRRSPIHELVNKDSSGLRHLIRALREDKNISILIDQHASHKEGVENVFFGQPCRTHRTPALLHLKTGIPIMPELTRRTGDDFEFELIVGDLIRYQPTGDREKDIQTVCQLCTTALEELISRDPSQWLWAHRRWLNINRKHRDKDDSAPAGNDTAPAENLPETDH